MGIKDAREIKAAEELLEELISLQKEYGFIGDRQRIKIIKDREEGHKFIKKFGYFYKVSEISASDTKLIDEIKRELGSWDRVLVIADFNSRVYEIYKPSGEPKADSCFVVTATYGSSFAPEVKTFKEFRDEVLLKSRIGRKLVKVYYRYSPPVAATIASRDYLRKIIRILFLSPILRLIKLTNIIF